MSSENRQIEAGAWPWWARPTNRAAAEWCLMASLGGCRETILRAVGDYR